MRKLRKTLPKKSGRGVGGKTQALAIRRGLGGRPPHLDGSFVKEWDSRLFLPSSSDALPGFAVGNRFDHSGRKTGNSARNRFNWGQSANQPRSFGVSGWLWTRDSNSAARSARPSWTRMMAISPNSVRILQ